LGRKLAPTQPKNENEFDPASFLSDPPIERALSIETLKSGGWRVGIHIADAAEYVQPETPIDREAPVSRGHYEPSVGFN
jgi:RNAse R (EC 3.1.-.-)